MLRTLNQKLLLVSLTTLTAVALLLGIAVSTVFVLRQSATDLIVDNHETELLGQIDTNLVRAAGEAATFAGVRDVGYLDEAREALERARTVLEAFEQISHNDTVVSTDLQHEDLIQRQAALIARVEQGINGIVRAAETNDDATIRRALETLYAYEADAEQLRADIAVHSARDKAAKEQAIFDAIQRALYALASALSLFVLLNVLLAMFTRQRVIQPIKQLSNAAVAVASGRLDQGVGVTNNDEIGDLQQAFNQMVSNLRDQHTKLQQQTVELAETVREAEAARLAAEHASQTKSLFLANMSHELRTPLNAIIGYAELLQEEAEEEGYTACLPDLVKIQTAGTHLLSLINDILDLSKIEAGKLELVRDRVEIASLLADVTTTVQPLVRKHANTLRVQCATGIGLMHSDATRVRQILLNLLGNARSSPSTAGLRSAFGASGTRHRNGCALR